MATRLPGGRTDARAKHILFAASLLFGVLLSFLIKPIVFIAGDSDDGRYLAAARAWIRHGPVVGTIHWDLRHPLVLPLAAATSLFGEGTVGLLAVPLVYALALALVTVVYLRARAGQGVAILWTVFFAINPLVHELATRLYPDLGETFFVVTSLAGCAAAQRSRGARRVLLLLGAGVSASLALLMRETSGAIVFVFALGFLTGYGLPRRDWLLVLTGAVPLLALDYGWLYLQTGDPIYRLHVALRHVEVPSNHMAGKVFTGEVLFNPALASRWIVSGPVDVHWTVNPWIYLLLDPFYGGSFVLTLALAILARIKRVRLRPGDARLLAAMTAYAAVSFAFVTYALMISQRPRYYVLALLVAMVANAMLAVRLRPVACRWVTALVMLQLTASAVIIAVRHPADHQLPAAVAAQ